MVHLFFFKFLVGFPRIAGWVRKGVGTVVAAVAAVVAAVVAVAASTAAAATATATIACLTTSFQTHFHVFDSLVFDWGSNTVHDPLFGHDRARCTLSSSQQLGAGFF